MTSTTLPRHIGYIVDGNRRWAREHGKTSREGHYAGYVALKDVAFETIDRGVRYVSGYVFSTENWRRSDAEVNAIMALLLKVLKADLPLFIARRVRLRVLGSRDRLNTKIIAAIDAAEAATKECKAGQMLLCLNYGGRQEIVDAVREIVRSGLVPEKVTTRTIEEHLYAPDVPPCDLIVRTSGEWRLSNFMLWRAAYSELLFLDKFWPDMTKQDVTAILEEYTRRNRRFGG